MRSTLIRGGAILLLLAAALVAVRWNSADRIDASGQLESALALAETGNTRPAKAGVESRV
jgi:hypothetical protein